MWFTKRMGSFHMRGRPFPSGVYPDRLHCTPKWDCTMTLSVPPWTSHPRSVTPSLASKVTSSYVSPTSAGLPKTGALPPSTMELER